MAIGALVVRHPDVLRLSVGPVHVALGALYLRVHPGERIARLRVIELPDIDLFPVHEVVAGLAVRPQASLVLILMTRGACRRKSQVGFTQIFFSNERPILRWNVGRIVAPAAGQSGVLAFQQISRFFVIESLRIPLHQREILTVVFRVTARAFLARAKGNVVGGV